MLYKDMKVNMRIIAPTSDGYQLGTIKELGISEDDRRYVLITWDNPDQSSWARKLFKYESWERLEEATTHNNKAVQLKIKALWNNSNWVAKNPNFAY